MNAPERIADPHCPAFLGVRFAGFGMAHVIEWVWSAARSEAFSYLVTPNVDHVIMLNATGGERWREVYRAAVEGSDLTINDSRILQRLAAMSGISLPVTPGSDLIAEMVRQARGQTGVLALVGGRPPELHWLRDTLSGWTVTHFEPPMGVRDDETAQDAIADFVDKARADIVLFAIGAPQSEIVCHRIACRGRARGVALCIGASVEFLSGSKQRAPAWMQRAGLEWLFRLASEPRRLWRRYLVEGPRIFRLWWGAHRSRS